VKGFTAAHALTVRSGQRQPWDGLLNLSHYTSDLTQPNLKRITTRLAQPDAIRGYVPALAAQRGFLPL
jgi:hypothetical protein